MKRWVMALEAAPPLDTACVLTLLLMLVHPIEYWYVKQPVAVLALLGLLYAPARGNPFLWFSIGIFFLVGCYQNWASADNHKYLTAYWCVAVFLALKTNSREADLATSARLMIGFAFFLAVAAKLLSDDYCDGSFFEYTLLTDRRFATVSQLVGGLTAAELKSNHQLISSLSASASTLTSVHLSSRPAIGSIAQLLTWWGLAVEAAVALCFLVPTSWNSSRRRDYFLMAFIATTYAVAPVLAFGWIIAIMGFVQTNSPNRRASYVALLLLMELYALPWWGLFQQGGA